MTVFRNIFFCAAVAAALPAVANVDQLGWMSHQDDTYGFALSYPSSIFKLVPAAAEDAARDKAEGRSAVTLKSKDGKARLVAGAAINADGISIADYRKQNLAESYADAKITYARTKDNWFVVSGNRGDEVFYERVLFTCGGRMINIWAMTYPMSEGDLYDRVVERVFKTFRPVVGAEACKS
jgi:hypothetical protein